MGIFSHRKRTIHKLVNLSTIEQFKTNLSYQVTNLQGIGTCNVQEDSFAFVNALDVTKIKRKGLLAVLSDGMGGLKEGSFASETAVNSLVSAFQDFDYDVIFSTQLIKSMLIANEKVRNALNGQGGCTAIEVFIFEERLYFASVGDSCLFIKRNDMLYRLNVEHNILNYNYINAIEMGDMSPYKSDNTSEENVLTSFLGIDDIKEIDYLKRPISLLNGDIILICSDGIVNTLSEEILLLCLNLNSTDEMKNAIEKNIAISKQNYQDNYTALIIKCEY